MLRISDDIEGFCAAKNSKDGALGILAILLDNIRDMDRDIGKRTIYVAILIAVFELLNRAFVHEANLSGFQITDMKVIEKMLPIVIAYLNLSCWSLIATRRLTEEIYDAFIQHLYPSLWKKDLEIYLRPPHFIKSYQLLAREVSGPFKSMIKLSTGPIMWILGFTVPIFTVYAGFSLFSKYPWDPLSIISVALSAILVFQMYVLTRGTNKATGGRTLNPAR